MEKHLDRIDIGILAALQNDGRLSNKELAAGVGLAPSSCLARVNRLRERGVLRAAHAEVDPSALGIGLQAIVVVRFARHNRETLESFRVHLATLPEVVQAFSVGGADDVLVHVAVRDANHLRDLVMDGFSDHPEVVQTRTEVVFDHVRRSKLPVYL